MYENLAINCFCPHCGNHIRIQIERTGQVGGIIGGAISGAIMGSNIGIAAGPLGAIAGTIPGLVIGAILGDNIGSKIDNPICSNCNTSFKIPQQSINEYKQRLKNIEDFIQNPLDGEEILTLRYEYYTYFYRFIQIDPIKILERYTLNEFDKTFKSSKTSGQENYDLDYELDINNGTITSHLMIFKKLLHLFNLDENYLSRFSKMTDEVQVGQLSKESMKDEIETFIKDFKTKYLYQLRTSTNSMLPLILGQQKDSDFYGVVIHYFFYMTLYLLHMQKAIERNLKEYSYESLIPYISQLAVYYSDHLLDLQTNLRKNMNE